MTRVRAERVFVGTIVALIAALLSVGFLAGIPQFHSGIAKAEMTYKTINYGASAGRNISVLSNAGWQVVATDTTGSPVATLRFQADCNLVEYRYVNHITSVTWASNTARSGQVCSLVFQTDGNVVIYHNTAQWATGTNRGLGYNYYYDVYSTGENDIWQYDPGYGYRWLWGRP